MGKDLLDRIEEMAKETVEKLISEVSGGPVFDPDTLNRAFIILIHFMVAEFLKESVKLARSVTRTPVVFVAPGEVDN